MNEGGVVPPDGVRRYTHLEQGEFVLSPEELNKVGVYSLAGIVSEGLTSMKARRVNPDGSFPYDPGWKPQPELRFDPELTKHEADPYSAIGCVCEHGNDSHGDGGVACEGWNDELNDYEECDCGGIAS